MRNKTFPKENQKKLNQIIRDLKSKVKSLEKHVKFLENEINNLVKPVRDRKNHVEKDKLSHENWKKDFIKRFKRDVLGEKE